MNRPHLIIRSASTGVYFALSFAVLYWFADERYFCALSPLRSTFRLSLACTILDLLACIAGLWLAQKIMSLRTAAPLLAGAITGAALASIPFWIHRCYGRFSFVGTPADISCFFAEGYGIAFPFVIAPALGFLTLIHGIVWLRASKEAAIAVVG